MPEERREFPNVATVMFKTRPRLSQVAPLVAAICWGYAVVNMLLGLGMFLIYNGTIAPIAVANILNYREWGIVYFTIGASTAAGLIRNNWELTRNTQVAGLVVKAVWAIALILRSFLYPQTALLTFVWLFFAYIQAVTYIYFKSEMTVRSTDGAN